jgi:predicted phosphodiesterase
VAVKIGIISDIHGNLGALQAVLAALEQQGCAKILCAGDVVGYGPRPQQCIEVLREKQIPCVLGNHDSWVAHGARDWGINPDARNALAWTADALSPEARDWLGNLPRLLQYGGIEVVHASHAWAPRWPYLLDERRVFASFLFQTAVFTFHGHTHIPLLAVHQRGHRPRLLKLRTMELPRGCRSLANAGAVGQPRDGNPHASCLVFETKDRQLHPLRVSYDVAETQRQMREAALPERLILRLAEGR